MLRQLTCSDPVFQRSFPSNALQVQSSQVRTDIFVCTRKTLLAKPDPGQNFRGVQIFQGGCMWWGNYQVILNKSAAGGNFWKSYCLIGKRGFSGAKLLYFTIELIIFWFFHGGAKFCRGGATFSGGVQSSLRGAHCAPPAASGYDYWFELYSKNK